MGAAIGMAGSEEGAEQILHIGLHAFAVGAAQGQGGGRGTGRWRRQVGLWRRARWKGCSVDWSCSQQVAALCCSSSPRVGTAEECPPWCRPGRCR